MSTGEPLVTELAPRETHPLRRTVLRTGTPSDAVEFEGDELETTIHLGVRSGTHGTIVAVSTWLERRWPTEPDTPAFQIRGMATAPDLRRSGFGTLVLQAGIERCAERGAELVWARARVTAIDFYVRRGFEAVGGAYLDAATALPHRDIVRRIA